MTIQRVIFTDLDGTLLDHESYEWQAAQEAISAAKHLNIPIIINTSKTRSEVIEIQAELSLKAFPYVVENGSAIIFPELSSDLLRQVKSLSEYQFTNGQHTIVLGEDRKSLCLWLSEIKASHQFKIESYQDWSTEQIMKKTGLPRLKALASQNKEFSEPFLWLDSDEQLIKFTEMAEKSGYSILKGGRFYHLQGKVTKANAFQFFKTYQSDLYPGVTSLNIIALGDNHNDVHMLNQSDTAICIKSPVNDFPKLDKEGVIYTEEYGPTGWNTEILKLLTKTYINKN